MVLSESDVLACFLYWRSKERKKKDFWPAQNTLEFVCCSETAHHNLGDKSSTKKPNQTVMWTGLRIRLDSNPYPTPKKNSNPAQEKQPGPATSLKNSEMFWPDPTFFQIGSGSGHNIYKIRIPVRPLSNPDWMSTNVGNLLR